MGLGEGVKREYREGIGHRLINDACLISHQGFFLIIDRQVSFCKISPKSNMCYVNGVSFLLVTLLIFKEDYERK